MDTVPAPWSLARKLAFRFAFLYWLLYSLPFPLTQLPWTGWIVGPWNSGLEALVLWCGHHVLGIEGPIPTAPTGSGDTTYAFVSLAVHLALALLGTTLWSVLARRRADERRLVPWAHAYVRLVLGATMLSYGAYKVIPSQFPAPSLDRLAQPFGEASPMGLLWTFMGTSAAYQIFTGAGEILGGVLLFQRRTSVLGALVSIAVLAQVVMLNFCFDVPVKLYSSHLLLMAVFLLLPESANLFGLLVRGRPARAFTLPRLFAAPRLHHGARLLRTAFGVFVAYQALSASRMGRAAYAVPPASPFDGIWHVEELADEGPAPLPPESRWTELVVANRMRLGATDATGRYERLQIQLDEQASSFTLARRGDPSFQATLAYERPSPDVLVLSGTLDGHAVRLTLARRPERDYLLVERGFHWINEVPFNR